MPLVIYNKGRRLFTHHTVELPAGKKTPIPAEHEESARKLLTGYPDELIEAGEGQGALSPVEAAAHAKEVTDLKQQIANLQKLLTNGSNKDVVLIRQANDELVEENVDLRRQVDALTKEVEGLRGPAVGPTPKGIEDLKQSGAGLAATAAVIAPAAPAKAEGKGAKSRAGG